METGKCCCNKPCCMDRNWNSGGTNMPWCHFAPKKAETALASAGPWQGSEAITGVWGRRPQRGLGDKAPWSWIFLAFCVSKGSRKFAPLLKKGKYNAAVLKCGALAMAHLAHTYNFCLFGLRLNRQQVVLESSLFTCCLLWWGDRTGQDERLSERLCSIFGRHHYKCSQLPGKTRLSRRDQLCVEWEINSADST